MDYLLQENDRKRCPRGYVLVGNQCVLLEDDSGIFGDTRPRVLPPTPEPPTPEPPTPEPPTPEPPQPARS